MFNICSLTVIMFLHTETSKHQVKWGNQGHIVKSRGFLRWWCTVVLILSGAMARILTFPPHSGSLPCYPQHIPYPILNLCTHKLHNWRFLSWLKAKMIVLLLLKCKHHKSEKLGLSSHFHVMRMRFINSSLKMNFCRREQKDYKFTGINVWKNFGSHLV